MQIDLEPRSHSHLYEVKPMSRWWFALSAFFGALCMFVMGFTNGMAWACMVAGAMITAFAVLCFPRHWLSKTKD